MSKYNQPRQSYDWSIDWSIENKGEGKVLLATSFPVMQIGAIKDSLKSLIKSLDKFADERGVPNDLDDRGRKR